MVVAVGLPEIAQVAASMERPAGSVTGATVQLVGAVPKPQAILFVTMGELTEYVVGSA